MTDDRLLHAFTLLDTPVHPDAAFADRLFDELAADLGFRRVARPSSPPLSRLRRALGIDRLPAGATTLRLAYLGALVGLLLALLAGSLFVASLLRTRPRPVELVRLSQAVYADAPAVRFTIRDSMGTSVIESDGHGTWRSETPDLPQGSYFLYDGTRVGYYDAMVRAWSISPVENGGPPFPMNDEFNWVRMSFPGLVATISTLDCSDAVDAGEGVVAGRPADHVRCPGLGLEYWLDRETHLVLRLAAKEGTVFWDGGPEGQDSVTEVTAFEEVDAPVAADFAWTGPLLGARGPGPVPGTKLVVGSPPPAWTGTTIQGKPFATGILAAPAALLFMWTSTTSGVRVYDTFTSSAATHPGVTSVIVGLEDLGTMVGFTGQHPTTLDVVADGDQALATAWGVLTIPEIVLIDGSGAVADVVYGDLSPADLDRVLSALEEGQPVPPVQPATASADPSPVTPTSTPAFDFVCTEAYVVCRESGATLPGWSGEQMSGGTFGSAAVAGRPAVIWFTTFRCDGPCPDWVTGELRQFGALAEEYGDRATLLAIADGEGNPGDTQALLDAAGVDFPVVFDWDGAIGRALDTNMDGVLVVDAEGRVVDQVVGTLGAVPIRSALDRLLATPSTAPSAP